MKTSRPHRAALGALAVASLLAAAGRAGAEPASGPPARGSARPGLVTGGAALAVLVLNRQDAKRAKNSREIS